MQSNQKNKIVLIAGGSGSGKTFFVHKLIQKIGSSNCCILSEDNYYKDFSSIDFQDRENINFDAPESKEFDLLLHHLSELRNGGSIKMPVYDFTTHTRKTETILIYPKPIIIAEGILILNNRTIFNLANLRIYIDTPDDIRLIRRLRRDTRERGRSIDSVLKQYINSVRPMFYDYVLPSKETADLIISGENYNPQIVTNILQILNQELRIKN